MIVKLGELQELIHENLIILIYTDSYVGKVAFGNAKILFFSEGNCTVLWNRLVNIVHSKLSHPAEVEEISITVSWTQLKNIQMRGSQIWMG